MEGFWVYCVVHVVLLAMLVHQLKRLADLFDDSKNDGEFDDEV